MLAVTRGLARKESGIAQSRRAICHMAYHRNVGRSVNVSCRRRQVKIKPTIW